jgi:hypothetical protein
VEYGAEPPVQRWVKQWSRDDDGHVAHLLNLLSSTLLTYAFVTRGGLVVARGIGAIYARAR